MTASVDKKQSARTGVGGGRGGRPSRQQAAELQDAILDAAEALFLQQGFGGTGVEAIAGRAGTTKATVYARFGSKEALFVAVSNRVLSTRFAPVLATSGTLAARLEDLALQMLDAVLDPKILRMHGIITAEAERFPELAALTDQESAFAGRRVLESLLAAERAAGRLAGHEVAVLARLFIAMVVLEPLRQVSLGLRAFEPPERHAWVRLTVSIFLDGCHRAGP